MLLFSLFLASLSHAASAKHAASIAKRLPASAVVWTAAELAPETASMPNKVSLQLVMLKDSGWTMEQVKSDVQEAARIFGQCQLQIARAEFRAVSAPDGILDFAREKDDPSTAPNSLRGLALHFADLDRPIAFFVRDFYYASDKKASGSGTPFSKANFAGDPPLPEELLNSVWMPATANAPDYYETHCKSTQYAVFAHELAHVLTGDGQHNVDAEANILSQCMGGRRNNKLTPKQCEAILANPLVSQ